MGTRFGLLYNVMSRHLMGGQVGYGGSVSCRCVARGLVEIPPALADVVTISARFEVEGPRYTDPKRALFDRWKTEACAHEGFEAVEVSLANNRMMGILDSIVAALSQGDPAIMALSQALPEFHGDQTPPALAREAIDGVDRVVARLGQLPACGLDSEDGLLFWQLGSSMRIWLSGSKRALTATVADGVIGILIDGVEQICGRTLHISPTGEGDDARFFNPETGEQALARWPYSSRVLRAHVGPVPADRVVPLLQKVRLLLLASVEQDMPVWWG